MNTIKSILFSLSITVVASSQANVNAHFNEIKNSPNDLYAFFKMMPKGGELHYHLAGGPYPETMLKLISKGNYCLDKNSLTVTKTTKSCAGISSEDIAGKPALYSAIIRDWSMKDFIPGKETGHDHFFNSFRKYITIVFDYRPFLLADVIKRAAQQHEHYLEIMDVPDNAYSITFGDLIKNSPSFAQKRDLLLSNKDFQNNITKTVVESEQIIDQTRELLDCKNNPQTDVCQIKVKFLYYSLREQPMDGFFAQTLNAFEAVSRSKGTLVGVNLVQPEDGIISLQEYHQQMLAFQYLHKLYPTVKIALHAGELAPEMVEPEELSYHIYDALFTGSANRIGHGVDIAYENNAEDILHYMAKQQIPVEINLISNLKILNVSGRNHPLNYYLSHHVPVVLSTDDEGVLRTDLTRQYVEAAINHHLDYDTLRHINRNALTFSFLPGASLWTDANKELLVPNCLDLDSQTCHDFIKLSEKAQLQWALEKKLSVFENTFK